MKFKNDGEFLIAFQDCMAGLNFAKEDEGYYLRKIVHEKLLMKRQKREGILYVFNY